MITQLTQELFLSCFQSIQSGKRASVFTACFVVFALNFDVSQPSLYVQMHSTISRCLYSYLQRYVYANKMARVPTSPFMGTLLWIRLTRPCQDGLTVNFAASADAGSILRFCPSLSSFVPFKQCLTCRLFLKCLCPFGMLWVWLLLFQKTLISFTLISLCPEATATWWSSQKQTTLARLSLTWRSLLFLGVP